MMLPSHCDPASEFISTTLGTSHRQREICVSALPPHLLFSMSPPEPVRQNVREACEALPLS